MSSNVGYPQTQRARGPRPSETIGVTLGKARTDEINKNHSRQIGGQTIPANLSSKIMPRVTPIVSPGLGPQMQQFDPEIPRISELNYVF